jgi:ATP-binding cassette subfamily G (WHITE) protein 2
MRRLLGTAVVATLSLAWTSYGYSNYSSIDMMRAQLALMDDRPEDCPPWYNAPISSQEMEYADKSQF